eukprot:Em0006g1400a
MFPEGKRSISILPGRQEVHPNPSRKARGPSQSIPEGKRSITIHPGRQEVHPNPSRKARGPSQSFPEGKRSIPILPGRQEVHPNPSRKARGPSQSFPEGKRSQSKGPPPSLAGNTCHTYPQAQAWGPAHLSRLTVPIQAGRRLTLLQ